MKKPTTDPVELRRQAEAQLLVYESKLETQNEELQHAQVQATQSLQHYNELFDFAPIGYFRLAVDGAIRAVNVAGAGIVATPRTKLIGMRFQSFLTEGAQHALRDFLAQLFAGATGLECEVEIKSLHETAVFVNLSGTITRGTQECLIAAVDITARMLSRQELVESERRFQYLLANVNLIAVMLDCAGRITYCNDYLLRLTGWQRDEILLHDWLTLFVPRELGVQQRFAQQALQDAITPHFECDILTRWGERRTIALNNTMCRGAYGRVVSITSLGEDITDRVRSEGEVRRLLAKTEQGQLALQRSVTDEQMAKAALRQSEERHRTFAELTSDYVYIYRVEPDGRPVLEWTSEAFTRIMGYTAEEYRALPSAFDIVHPEDQPILMEAYGHNLAGETTTNEIRAITKQGEVRWMQVYVRPTWDAEHTRVVAVYGAAQEITERKHAEEIVLCHAKVLEMIAGGVPLAETMHTMLRLMERFAPGMLCSVLSLDADGLRLWHLAAPSLPEAFNRAVDGKSIGPSAGSCGTAAFRREEVIVEDIAIDPLWADYRELALAHGLRACWSTPIFDQQQSILGTFAIYYRHAGRPSQLHRRCIELATRLAALAIGKDRNETALRRSESRYRRLVESNVLGVTIARTDGTISEANDRFLQMVGYSRAELRAGHLRWDSITPLEWTAVDQQAVRDIETTGVASLFEKEYFHKDGHRVPIQATVATLEGTPGDCLCLIEDIAERKQAEAALRESQASLEKAQHQAKLGSWKLYPSLKTGTWSKEMYSLFDRDPALGPPPLDEFLQSVHPDDRSLLAQAEELALASAGIVENVFRTNHTFGPIRHFQFRYESLKDQDGIAYFAGTTQDITETGQAEQALRESNERLQVLSRRVVEVQEDERRHLARELHDEIGQLLTSVNLGLHAFKNVAGPDVDGRLKNCVNLVEIAMERVRGLSLDLRPSMLDMFGLESAVRWYAERMGQQAGITVDLAMGLEGERLSGTLETACFRVVQEALTNVARHAHATKVTIRLDRDKDSMRLTIQDDGVGFDVSAIEQRAGQGESFGVFSMRERVQLLGGQFELVSSPGRGTFVSACLPIGEEN